MKLKLLVLIVMTIPQLTQAQRTECDLLDPIYWMTTNFRHDIGDTLSIEKFSAYLEAGLKEKSHPDFHTDSILRRYYFPVADYGNIQYVGRYLNEGEYISVTVYAVRKKDCEILSKLILAEAAAWENGYRETSTIVTLAQQWQVIKKLGTKDLGGRQIWQNIEKYYQVELTPSGIIKKELLDKKKYLTKAMIK